MLYLEFCWHYKRKVKWECPKHSLDRSDYECSVYALICLAYLSESLVEIANSLSAFLCLTDHNSLDFYGTSESGPLLQLVNSLKSKIVPLLLYFLAEFIKQNECKERSFSSLLPVLLLHLSCSQGILGQFLLENANYPGRWSMM